MDRKPYFPQTVLLAVVFSLYGLSILFLRFNSRTVGGFMIANGLIWGWDAVLISRGVPSKSRLGIRMVLIAMAACIVVSLWYFGIN